MKNVHTYFLLSYRFAIQTVKFFTQYFIQGYRAGLFKLYIKHFIVRHIQEFIANIKKESEEMDSVESPRMQKLAQVTAGLHSLLPPDKRYTYSILIAIEEKPSVYLKKAIESALNQTAPQMEVLIGYPSSFSQEIEAFIKEFDVIKQKKLQFFSFAYHTEVELLNQLAHQAMGYFLLPLRSIDWLRPDFLFRCEQFLRLTHPSFPLCFYTNEFAINAYGYPLPGRHWHKPTALYFPYVFKDYIGHSLLIPRDMWLKVKGIRRSLSCQGLWELSLRLDLEGVNFCHLPFGLYAHRSTFPESIDNKQDFLKILEASTQAKNLRWFWTEGLLPHTFRAVPVLEEVPRVQVIIPYKNQKELTLKAIYSVQKQKGVQPFITAVDNNSDDLSIAQLIEQVGGEVLSIQEPFNFSRLNNLAVERTQTAQSCEYLLFLNNDVELAEGALEEMCRWIKQPSIGFVGCLLYYPNGLLQHGGVDIKHDGPAQNITWIHSEKMRYEAKMSESKVIRLTEAVTAACALIKRSIFLEVGGFDEIWYPVAYSDTNLAVKLTAKGLKCLYTPYAQGIHYESMSRRYENIEDFENSKWLHDYFIVQHLSPTSVP